MFLIRVLSKWMILKIKKDLKRQSKLVNEISVLYTYLVTGVLTLNSFDQRGEA
ncbi:hypothetical protein M942_21195 [Enterobacter ludwigii]|nr:hypothetical protein M942_21195 [Enterobacter ludwigii]